MSHPTIEQVKEYTRAKKSGSGWKGHCPSHDDKNPSLSIGVDRDGKPLVYCHVCNNKDPWNALVAVFKNATPINKTAKETVFYYEDENESFNTVRATRLDYSDGTKSFFQSYLGENKWLNGRGGRKVKPYLYSEWKSGNHSLGSVIAKY